jgi:predicted nucleic acid-binding protein
VTTAVDSNVLLDLLSEGSPGSGEAHDALLSWSRKGDLILSEVVFAEVSVAVDEEAGMSGFIGATGLKLVPSSIEALQVAGRNWREYLTPRPRGLGCPKCGELNVVACASCGEPLRTRQHLAPDFMIGAHALIHADRLLTTDRGFYRNHFAGLTVVGY